MHMMKHKDHLSKHYITLRDWQIVSLAEGIEATVNKSVNTRLAMDFTDEEKDETEARLLDDLAKDLKRRANNIRRGRVQDRKQMTEAEYMSQPGATYGT